MTMDQYYIDFFDFLIGLIDPLLPESTKANETYIKIKEEVPAYLKTTKGFVYVNAALGEACKKEQAKVHLKNIVSVTEDPERMLTSIAEIKTLARTVAEHCNNLANTTDAEIAEKIEMFALYVDIITKQFIKK